MRDNVLGPAGRKLPAVRFGGTEKRVVAENNRVV